MDFSRWDDVKIKTVSNFGDQQGIMQKKPQVSGRLFRVREWLMAKWLFNLAIALVLLTGAKCTPLAMLRPGLLIMWYVLCIGAFGYFINDLFDAESDRRSGKPAQRPLPGFLKPGIPLLLILAGTLPYLFLLDHPGRYLILLLLQVLLLFTYAVPGIKMKQYFPGLIWDALYSYVLPALIAAELVRQCTGLPVLSVLQQVLALGWLSFLGLRSILNHQLGDLENDVRAGIRTFTVTAGEEVSYRMLQVCSIMEGITFMAMVYFAFEPLWGMVLLSFILYFFIEVILGFRSFQRTSGKGQWWVLLNHFYDYYLFMGIMLWMSWTVHPAFVLIPAVYAIFRLDLLRWFWHHILLWLYYKTLGLFRRIQRNH